MAALEAQFLSQLPGVVRRGEPANELPQVLSLGPELNEILPDGGLPRGTVVEFSVAGGFAMATSLALAACRSAQEEALALGSEDVPWCAFVDPSGTLHGPGVAGASVRLSRLLVVRPTLAALERTAIRLAESRAFAVVVIDTMGVAGASLGIGLATWPRVVRRIALAIEGSGVAVVLITDGEARRPLPLPVGLRLEVSRSAEDRLSVRVGKERRGRISGPRTVVWSKPRAKPLRGLPPPKRASA